MASDMQLEGVNVANCKSVSASGLFALLGSRSLEELSFSADQINEKRHLLLLIERAVTLKHIEIVDPSLRIPQEQILASASKKGIQLLFRRDGALKILKCFSSERPIRDAEDSWARFPALKRRASSILPPGDKMPTGWLCVHCGPYRPVVGLLWF